MISLDIYNINSGIVSVNVLSQPDYINELLNKHNKYYSNELINMCKSMLILDYKNRPNVYIIYALYIVLLDRYSSF